MALNLPYMARVSQTTSQHAEPCTKQVAGSMLPAIDSSTPHPVREVNAHLVVGSETSTGRRQSLVLTFRFYSTCTSKPRVASDPGEKKNPSQQ